MTLIGFGNKVGCHKGVLWKNSLRLRNSGGTDPFKSKRDLASHTQSYANDYIISSRADSL